MSYFVQHWKGQFSLARSFWINYFCLNLSILILDVVFTNEFVVENPIVAARIKLFFLALWVFIYPWQIVGLWRASHYSIVKKKKRFRGWFIQGLIVVSIVYNCFDLISSREEQICLLQRSLMKDPLSNYEISICDEGRLLYFNGDLGFGVSRDIEKVLKNNPYIEELVLDTHGGRVYEGRKLADIIMQYELNTCSLNGCFSVGTVAFIAGQNRSLYDGALLGFHLYYGYDQLEKDENFQEELNADLLFFEKQGVSKQFCEFLSATVSNDIWCPTYEELLSSGIIQEIKNISHKSRKRISEDGDPNCILSEKSNSPAFEMLKDKSDNWIKEY